MTLIPDDPIVASIQRTGYPYWMSDDPEPEEEPEEEYDRITIRDKWGSGTVWCPRDQATILERLAAFEDLGYSPERLQEILEEHGL